MAAVPPGTGLSNMRPMKLADAVDSATAATCWAASLA